MTADETRSLASDFASYSATLRGIVGLAFAPVGGERVVALGAWTGGVAWSTSKVPLAVAALRAAPVDAKTYAVPAITRSDNVAAERLWSMLGSPAVAAAAVTAVLGEGGDVGTRVESRRVRPEYTAFGQTEWSAARQALFTAHLPCIEAGAKVLALMRRLDPGQRWGLARLAGAAAKGGWGPDETGAHLVRQLGVVPNGSGWTAVALGARPASGTFADGVALLDRLTRWVAEHLRQIPAGRCPP